MSQYELAPNEAMALSQLSTNEINQPELLEALTSTPRELFVPKHLAGVAYIDEALPIGEGRFILAPLDIARLLAAADIQRSERVLDIGCGFGYSSVVAAKLAREVVAIDTSAMFIKQLESTRSTLGIHNIRAHVVDDIAQGLEQAQPFDVIVINGAVEELPQTLLAQLAPGGRLVMVQVKQANRPGVDGLGVLTIVRKQGFGTAVEHGVECFVPPLAAYKKPAIFQFG